MFWHRSPFSKAVSVNNVTQSCCSLAHAWPIPQAGSDATGPVNAIVVDLKAATEAVANVNLENPCDGDQIKIIVEIIVDIIVVRVAYSDILANTLI